MTGLPADALDPARAALGERPRYFDDPASDQLMALVLALGTELAVTRERLDTVERLLAERAVLTQRDIDAWRPGATAKSERSQLHREFLRRFLRPITQARERLRASMDAPG
jgi:hypothetical protein